MTEYNKKNTDIDDIKEEDKDLNLNENVEMENFIEAGSENVRRTIIDDLENIEDENELFWKTPSSQRIVQGGSIMTMLDIITSIFFTFYMMMVARMPTDDSSMLAIIDTLSMMMKYLSVLGFTGVGSKMVSEYLVRDINEARIYGISASKYNFLLTGIPLITISILLAMTRPQNEIEQFAYFTLVIITILDRLQSNFTIYILAYKRYDLFAYAAYLPWGLQYIIAIIIYPIFGVVGIFSTFIFAKFAQFFLLMIMFKKCSEFPLKDVFSFHKEYGLFWKMFSFNFLYSLANLIFALVTTTMLITFGQSFGILTKQEIVALYTISTLSNLLINVFEIVTPIMVSISEGHSLKNPKLINNYTMLCVKFPILFSIAIVTFYLIFSVEIIELLYGPEWIPMGIVIVATLMPSYILGAFASRYDNIIAGIGRPEVVIIPWLLVFLGSLAGIIIAIFLPDIYLTGDKYLMTVIQKGVPTQINYGITLKFLFSLVTSSISLSLGGYWITKICLKVLGVKIPKSFFTRPLLTAFVTALILLPPVRIFPIKAIFINMMGMFGGYIYILVIALIGIILFLVLGILFDAINREDAIFWKNIIENFGPMAKILLKPVKGLISWLLIHQIGKFKTAPIEWISKTDKTQLYNEQIFKVKIISPFNKKEMQIDSKEDTDNMANHTSATYQNKDADKLGVKAGTKTPNRRNYLDEKISIPVTPGKEYPFKVILYDAKKDLFDIIIYAKVAMEKVHSSLKFFEHLEPGETIKTTINVKIPESKIKGVKELIIFIEAYEKARADLPPIKLLKKGFWTYFDYRIRWIHEESYYIKI